MRGSLTLVLARDAGYAQAGAPRWAPTRKGSMQHAWASPKRSTCVPRLHALPSLPPSPTALDENTAHLCRPLCQHPPTYPEGGNPALLAVRGGEVDAPRGA